MDDNLILCIKNVTKTFPGVKALDNVSFDVRQGTVHAICGENGAGKSTLMKIISGAYKRDSGQIFFEGKPLDPNITPKHSQALGISIIYQEFNLVNALTVAENIFLNRLAGGKGDLVNWKEINRKAEELLDRIGYKLDVKKCIRDLSVAQRQMVEIAKALSLNAKLVIMDEPSSVLTSKELETFFNVIHELRKQGVSVIYISHKLEEVFQLCDDVTIFRDGVVVESKPIGEYTKNDVIYKMVGRPIDVEYPARTSLIGEERLRIEHMQVKNRVYDVSLNVKRGEIVGILGLVGAGRTELVRAIFGADSKEDGKVFINGKEVSIASPSDAIRHGMILIPEDRREQGLFIQYSVRANVVAAAIKKTANGAFIVSGRDKQAAEQYIQEMEIKTPSTEQRVLNLSGGNQQKVVFSKSLYAEPEIFIMDEPTRGIDVGAKHDIYLIMNRLVAEGKSILFISSETPEVLGMSDRVIVLYEGRMNGEFQKDELHSERVMQAIVGA